MKSYKKTEKQADTTLIDEPERSRQRFLSQMTHWPNPQKTRKGNLPKKEIIIAKGVKEKRPVALEITKEGVHLGTRVISPAFRTRPKWDETTKINTPLTKSRTNKREKIRHVPHRLLKWIRRGKKPAVCHHRSGTCHSAILDFQVFN